MDNLQHVSCEECLVNKQAWRRENKDLEYRFLKYKRKIIQTDKVILQCAKLYKENAILKPEVEKLRLEAKDCRERLISYRSSQLPLEEKCEKQRIELENLHLAFKAEKNLHECGEQHIQQLIQLLADRDKELKDWQEKLAKQIENSVILKKECTATKSQVIKLDKKLLKREKDLYELAAVFANDVLLPKKYKKMLHDKELIKKLGVEDVSRGILSPDITVSISSQDTGFDSMNSVSDNEEEDEQLLRGVCTRQSKQGATLSKSTTCSVVENKANVHQNSKVRVLRNVDKRRKKINLGNISETSIHYQSTDKQSEGNSFNGDPVAADTQSRRETIRSPCKIQVTTKELRSTPSHANSQCNPSGIECLEATKYSPIHGTHAVLNTLSTFSLPVSFRNYFSETRLGEQPLSTSSIFDVDSIYFSEGEKCSDVLSPRVEQTSPRNVVQSVTKPGEISECTVKRRDCIYESSPNKSPKSRVCEGSDAILVDVKEPTPPVPTLPSSPSSVSSVLLLELERDWLLSVPPLLSPLSSILSPRDNLDDPVRSEVTITKCSKCDHSVESCSLAVGPDWPIPFFDSVHVQASVVMCDKQVRTDSSMPSAVTQTDSSMRSAMPSAVTQTDSSMRSTVTQTDSSMHSAMLSAVTQTDSSMCSAMTQTDNLMPSTMTQTDSSMRSAMTQTENAVCNVQVQADVTLSHCSPNKAQYVSRANEACDLSVDEIIESVETETVSPRHNLREMKVNESLVTTGANPVSLPEETAVQRSSNKSLICSNITSSKPLVQGLNTASERDMYNESVFSPALIDTHSRSAQIETSKSGMLRFDYKSKKAEKDQELCKLQNLVQWLIPPCNDGSDDDDDCDKEHETESLVASDTFNNECSSNNDISSNGEWRIPMAFSGPCVLQTPPCTTSRHEWKVPMSLPQNSSSNGKFARHKRSSAVQINSTEILPTSLGNEFGINEDSQKSNRTVYRGKYRVREGWKIHDSRRCTVKKTKLKKGNPLDFHLPVTIKHNKSTTYTNHGSHNCKKPNTPKVTKRYKVKKADQKHCCFMETTPIYKGPYASVHVTEGQDMVETQSGSFIKTSTRKTLHTNSHEKISNKNKQRHKLKERGKNKMKFGLRIRSQNYKKYGCSSSKGSSKKRKKPFVNSSLTVTHCQGALDGEPLDSAVVVPTTEGTNDLVVSENRINCLENYSDTSAQLNSALTSELNANRSESNPVNSELFVKELPICSTENDKCGQTVFQSSNKYPLSEPSQNKVSNNEVLTTGGLDSGSAVPVNSINCLENHCDISPQLNSALTSQLNANISKCNPVHSGSFLNELPNCDTTNDKCKQTVFQSSNRYPLSEHSQKLVSDISNLESDLYITALCDSSINNACIIKRAREHVCSEKLSVQSETESLPLQFQDINVSTVHDSSSSEDSVGKLHLVGDTCGHLAFKNSTTCPENWSNKVFDSSIPSELQTTLNSKYPSDKTSSVQIANTEQIAVQTAPQNTAVGSPVHELKTSVNKSCGNAKHVLKLKEIQSVNTNVTNLESSVRHNTDWESMSRRRDEYTFTKNHIQPIERQSAITGGTSAASELLNDEHNSISVDYKTAKILAFGSDVESESSDSSNEDTNCVFLSTGKKRTVSQLDLSEQGNKHVEKKAKIVVEDQNLVSHNDLVFMHSDMINNSVEKEITRGSEVINPFLRSGMLGRRKYAKRLQKDSNPPPVMNENLLSNEICEETYKDLNGKQRRIAHEPKVSDSVTLQPPKYDSHRTIQNLTTIIKKASSMKIQRNVSASEPKCKVSPVTPTITQRVQPTVPESVQLTITEPVQHTLTSTIVQSDSSNTLRVPRANAKAKELQIVLHKVRAHLNRSAKDGPVRNVNKLKQFKAKIVRTRAQSKNAAAFKNPPKHSKKKKKTDQQKCELSPSNSSESSEAANSSESSEAVVDVTVKNKKRKLNTQLSNCNGIQAPSKTLKLLLPVDKEQEAETMKVGKNYEMSHQQRHSCEVSKSMSKQIRTLKKHTPTGNVSKAALSRTVTRADTTETLVTSSTTPRSPDSSPVSPPRWELTPHSSVSSSPTSLSPAEMHHPFANSPHFPSLPQQITKLRSHTRPLTCKSSTNSPLSPPFITLDLDHKVTVIPLSPVRSYSYGRKTPSVHGAQTDNCAEACVERIPHVTSIKSEKLKNTRTFSCAQPQEQKVEGLFTRALKLYENNVTEKFSCLNHKSPIFDAEKLFVRCTLDDLLSGDLMSGMLVSAANSLCFGRVSDSLIVTKCIIQRVHRDASSPLDRSHTPPAPPLTATQQRLIMLVLKLQKTKQKKYKFLLEQILLGIEYRLLRLGKAPSIDSACALTRFYTALCRTQNDYGRVQTLLYDAVYCVKFKALPIIFTALTVYPEVLPTADHGRRSPLIVCIVHIIMNASVQSETTRNLKVKSLQAHLRNTYGYTNEHTTEDLFSDNMARLKDGDPVCIAVLILLGKFENYEWSSKKLISCGVLPTINEWKTGDVGEDVARLAVVLIGYILKIFPIDRRPVTFPLIRLLRCLLLEDSQASHQLQESVASTLVLLARHQFMKVLRILNNWQPSQEISEELVRRTQLVMEKQGVNWWNIFLKKNKNRPLTPLRDESPQ